MHYIVAQCHINNKSLTFISQETFQDVISVTVRTSILWWVVWLLTFICHSFTLIVYSPGPPSLPYLNTASMATGLIADPWFVFPCQCDHTDISKMRIWWRHVLLSERCALQVLKHLSFRLQKAVRSQPTYLLLWVLCLSCRPIFQQQQNVWNKTGMSNSARQNADTNIPITL